MRSRMHGWWTVALLMLLVACSRQPDGVLGSEKMARLLVDIHKAEAVAENNSRTYNDSLKRELRASIYAKHGVSSETVDSSLSWYGYNMEEYLEVYNRVVEILEKERDQVRAKGAVNDQNSDGYEGFEGDSVDVWQGVPYMRFSSNAPANMLTFNLKSDLNWSPGDAYTLRGKLVNASSPVEITMVARYRDGTDEFINQQFNGEGWHDLRLSLNKDKEASEVYGVISYRNVKGHTAYIDSISLTRTRGTGGQLDKESRQIIKTFQRRIPR